MIQRRFAQVEANKVLKQIDRGCYEVARTSVKLEVGSVERKAATFRHIPLLLFLVECHYHRVVCSTLLAS